MERLILLALLAALPIFAATSNFDWTGLDREIISEQGQGLRKLLYNTFLLASM